METSEGELITNMYLIGIPEPTTCINHEHVSTSGSGYTLERCIPGTESRSTRTKKLLNAKSSSSQPVYI